MPLHFVKGKSMWAYPADIRVNTINTVGVMRAGVARAFEARYPEMFEEYHDACLRGALQPGDVWVWQGESTDVVVNIATKRDWRNTSQYEWVERGLDKLEDLLDASDDDLTVTLPALGCGDGGLEWSRVRGLILRYLGDKKATIYVFEPRVRVSTV